MTREEKLDWLYRLKSEIFVCMPEEWLIPMADALDDAIKALEQEPTAKNDLGVDCISRKEVDRIINKWLSHPDYELKDHIYSMTEKIHNLPSVTPQEPTDNDVVLTYDMYHDLIADRAEKLEQELILDKIRAEIDNILSDGMIHKKTVLGIIDKYKAEMEVDNA